MSYAPGPTLHFRIVEHATMAAGQVRLPAHGLALARVAIHAAGVVHRDLKPSDIVLSPVDPPVAYATTGRKPFGQGSTSAIAWRVTTQPTDLDALPDELVDRRATAATLPGERQR